MDDKMKQNGRRTIVRKVRFPYSCKPWIIFHIYCLYYAKLSLLYFNADCYRRIGKFTEQQVCEGETIEAPL